MSSNENPYQYYESEPFNERPNRAINTNSRYVYTDPTFITSVLLIFLIATIAVDFVGGVISFWERVVLQNIQSGAYETEAALQAAATASDMRVMVVALLQTFIAIISGIVFLVWTHRVCKNAHYLNMAPMANTPGWAVGWYFVPVFLLWKPYQALREAFVASCHPEGEQSSGTAIFGLWWFVHISAEILGQISMRMAFNIGDSPEMAYLLTLNGVGIAGGVVGILLNILAIIIALRFARCQRETKGMIIIDDFV